MSYRTGISMVLLAGVFWSLTALAIRLIENATTWQILFHRSLGLVALLFVVVWYRSGGAPVSQVRQAGVPGVVGGLGLVAAFAGSVYSIQETTVANAVFLFATAPFFTAVLAWPVLRERVRRGTWVAIAVGMVGVVLMVQDGLASGALAGNIAAVFSAFGFAVFTLSLRWQKLDDMSPAVLLAGVMSLPVSFAACMLLGQSLVIDARDSALALFMGCGLLGLGLSIYTIGCRTVPAAELAILSMTEVLLGPVWVWMLLGETAGARTVIGGAILLVAIAGNALSGIRSMPPKLI